jgi:PII-like signaling protein
MNSVPASVDGGLAEASREADMMKGYQLTFYTEQNRRHGRQSVVEWLLSIAQHAGIHGATVVAAAEGVGHAGERHAARFFELADQPQQVIFAVTEAEAETLLAAVRQGGVPVFCTRCPIEFGMLGGEAHVPDPARR